jgi:hypothetical protein
VNARIIPQTSSSVLDSDSHMDVSLDAMYEAVKLPENGRRVTRSAEKEEREEEEKMGVESEGEEEGEDHRDGKREGEEEEEERVYDGEREVEEEMEREREEEGDEEEEYDTNGEIEEEEDEGEEQEMEREREQDEEGEEEDEEEEDDEEDEGEEHMIGDNDAVSSESQRLSNIKLAAEIMEGRRIPSTRNQYLRKIDRFKKWLFKYYLEECDGITKEPILPLPYGVVKDKHLW